MEVIVRPTTEDATNVTADIISRKLQHKPHMTLGLATGRTMENLYMELARKYQQENLDFSLARTFNLDEYIGLPPEDKNSYRYYMDYFLFDQVNIDKRNTYLPESMAEDMEAACRLYEQRIAEHGGIDLQLLGIGSDGHIGFNEPLSAIHSRTRSVALTPDTIEQNAPQFDEPSRMPKRAVTMGVGTILDAQQIVMLVTGGKKGEILAKAVEGPVSAMVTASALQFHPACYVICDEEAGAQLQGRQYYKWIFDNQPEWEAFRT